MTTLNNDVPSDVILCCGSLLNNIRGLLRSIPANTTADRIMFDIADILSTILTLPARWPREEYIKRAAKHIDLGFLTEEQKINYMLDAGHQLGLQLMECNNVAEVDSSSGVIYTKFMLYNVIYKDVLHLIKVTHD